jgi:hypothetical protein
VDLVNLGESLSRESMCRADQRRPEAAMDVGDLAVDEPAHEDFVGVADYTGELEDLVASGMRPPVSANGCARHGLRE